MFLVIDAGNTTTVVGVFDEKELLGQWRLSSCPRTVDETGLLLLNLLSSNEIDKSKIEGAILSSVVPAFDEAWQLAIRVYLKNERILTFSDALFPMPILMDNPSEVGADRLVNAVAAKEKYGAPLIVVDLGTAITLDVIDENGAYIGGAIAPGLTIAMETLFTKTAKLPQVGLSVPSRVIGKNTMDAIRSGIMYGFAGLIDSLVERIQVEMGAKCPVVATGGHSTVLSELSRSIDYVEPALTLEGLRILYEINKDIDGPCH